MFIFTDKQIEKPLHNKLGRYLLQSKTKMSTACWKVTLDEKCFLPVYVGQALPDQKPHNYASKSSEQ